MDWPSTYSDFNKNNAARSQGAIRRKAVWRPCDGDKPFGLHPDGRGWLYVSSGLKDGPLPTHYEPLESLVRECDVSRAQTTILPADKKERPDNPYAKSPDDPRFPYVLTTYRLTEHHTAGGMSRGLSHLAELQPEMFCGDLARAGAARSGVEHGDWVTIVTPRGAHLEPKRLVTARMLPLQIDGQNRPSGRAAVSLGIEGRGHRRCRQRSAGDL